MNAPEVEQLQLRNIAHSYGLDAVLEGIDLTLEKGQVISLVGSSGCGKSTLLLIAAGLLEPTGSGRPKAAQGKASNSFKRTACVFQEPRLLPWKRALDNIAWGLKATGIGGRQRLEQAYSVASEVGLAPDDLSKFPHELSGGMRQRVALARALAVRPGLLLLDEPFSALDVGLRRELQDLLLREIEERGLSVLLITHNLMEAVRMSHRILVMKPEPGRIVYRHNLIRPWQQRDREFVYRTTARLLDNPIINDAFSVSSTG